MVQILKDEEKGSDVNLATYLLCDAFESDFETAAVTPSASRGKFPRDGQPLLDPALQSSS
jgi:hypothetical protein